MTGLAVHGWRSINGGVENQTTPQKQLFFNGTNLFLEYLRLNVFEQNLFTFPAGHLLLSFCFVLPCEVRGRADLKEVFIILFSMPDANSR